MILFPFSFLASSGGATPENLTLPVIELIADNEFGYTLGTWDPSVVTPTTIQWFENDAATGLSTLTFVSSRGASVKLQETASNDFGSTSIFSLSVEIPDIVTPAVVTQTEPNFVIYDTEGIWSAGAAVTGAVWTINGVPTATAAVIGVAFDATTIGAVNADIITVTESIDIGFGTGIGNELSYLSFENNITENAALTYGMMGSVIDAIQAVTEDAALTYGVTGIYNDNVENLTEEASVSYSLTGSIV
jgi:hypothetical protein